MSLWRIPEESMKVVLPAGFSLWEDSELVYIFHDEEEVASLYHAVAHPAVLQSIAEERCAKIKAKE